MRGEGGTVNVELTVNTRWAVAWIRLMSVLRFVVGAQRAGDWAVWGAYRFTRFSVGQHRFRFRPNKRCA